MKTKLHYLIILLISFFNHASAQDYHPLLNNSSWIVNDMVSCCRPPYVRLINEGVDVVVGNYTYKKFNDPFPKYDLVAEAYIDSVAIREDVVARKVYKLVNGVDALLYDFSLENGDTVSQYGFTWLATVDDCDVDGDERKRITLHTIELYFGHSLTQIWIEGVGTVAHPFYPERNMYSVMSNGGGLTFHTKCSFQNGDHIYGNPECESLLPALDTAHFDVLPQNIVIYPNPFISEFTMTSASDFVNASIKLFNMQGQLVKEIKNFNGKTIVVDRENLNSGMYFAQVSESGKTTYTAKVMVR